MKFNLLAGITLLLMSSAIAEVSAQTTTPYDCGWHNKCVTTADLKQVGKLDNSVENPITIESLQLPQGEVSTVEDLSAKSQGNAVNLVSPKAIAQILPPTDSNGDRIFRPTRSGPSYIGIGLNAGLTGNGNLGDRSLVIVSKLGLTETLSIRPSIFLLGDFVSILIPVTYDFAPQQPFGDFRFSPYVGGGIAIDAGSNSSYGALFTAGIDIPLSSIFTVNVAANLAFLNNTEFGVVVGIGYNF